MKQKDVVITEKQQELMTEADVLSLSHEDRKLQFVTLRKKHELWLENTYNQETTT